MHFVSRSQAGRRMGQGETSVKALEVLLANERDSLDGGLLRLDVIHVSFEGTGALQRKLDKREMQDRKQFGGQDLCMS